MAVMPVQKPGKSKQDYQTPPEFIAAIKKRLGIAQFDADLAASWENTVVKENYYDEEKNALLNLWTLGSGWNWLNPPYSNIGDWVQKAWFERNHGAKTAMLVPASVGANWYKEWVEGKAYSTILNGRITFVGTEDPYPKDLMILLYAPYLQGGSCIWSWMK